MRGTAVLPSAGVIRASWEKGPEVPFLPTISLDPGGPFSPDRVKGERGVGQNPPTSRSGETLRLSRAVCADIATRLEVTFAPGPESGWKRGQRCPRGHWESGESPSRSWIKLTGWVREENATLHSGPGVVFEQQGLSFRQTALQDVVFSPGNNTEVDSHTVLKRVLTRGEVRGLLGPRVSSTMDTAWWGLGDTWCGPPILPILGSGCWSGEAGRALG